MSNLTTSATNNWFTLVDQDVQDQILSGVQGTTYQQSPFRKVMTGQSTFFSWSKPGAQAADGATLPPEITDSIVALRGYIVHYGSRLSLFDSANKKQICGSVSTVINYDENQNSILSKNAYPIPASIYGCTAFGEERQASAIIENFAVEGSRGQSCAVCIAKGEHKNSYVVESGAEEGKEKTDICGASIRVTMFVTEFAILEIDEATAQSVATWYKPHEYTNRKGNIIIQKPFIAELMIGKAAANKKIGKNFEVITEPNSTIPADSLTFVSYLSKLNAEKKVKVVKMNDRNLFDCEYAMLPMAVTEVWAGQVPPAMKNQMINCWPVFRTYPVSNADLNEYIQAGLAAYSEEKNNDVNLNDTPELTAAPTPALEAKKTTKKVTTPVEEDDETIEVSSTIVPETLTDLSGIFKRR